MAAADEKARLMKIKATLKKRQPLFIRQDAHKHKRVKQVWRKPKGLHSKMKDSKKGYRAKLQEGYHTPRAVRGLDKHGLKPTLTANVKELEKMSPSVHSIIILGGLGGRKKLAILEQAAKQKFVVVNAKPDAAESIKARLSSQHAQKKERETEKTSKQKSLEEKAAKAAKAAKEEEGGDVDTPEHKHAHESDDAAGEEKKSAGAKKATKKAAKPDKSDKDDDN